MSRSLRSRSMTDSVKKDELAELNEILAPLKANIAQTNEALAQIHKLYEEKFSRQQREIVNLQFRVQQLESKLSYQEHVTALHDRRLDDLEQVSRKVNSRLKGIEVLQGDSPEKLKATIKAEIDRLGIEIPVEEIDRCHRVGRSFFSGASSKVQDVLVKFRTWHSRDLMYQRRKEFTFKAYADLTSGRSNLLKRIRDFLNEVDGEPTSRAAERVVDFVFADKNCKIKFKSHAGRYYTVNSELESLSLVSRLDDSLTHVDAFKADEDNRSKYDRYTEEETPNEIFW